MQSFSIRWAGKDGDTYHAVAVTPRGEILAEQKDTDSNRCLQKLSKGMQELSVREQERQRLIESRKGGE